LPGSCLLGYSPRLRRLVRSQVLARLHGVDGGVVVDPGQLLAQFLGGAREWYGEGLYRHDVFDAEETGGVGRLEVLRVFRIQRRGELVRRVLPPANSKPAVRQRQFP
jgi:hypothetical protein